MISALARAFAFLFALSGIYVYLGHTITVMTGGDRAQRPVEGVNAEAGEAIFFGKGKCSTCHSIGDRGSAVRCPNLGVKGEKFESPIGARALERARERSDGTGREWRSVDYLYECIANPSGYVVDGFKDEMPTVYKPPIALNVEEVQAVIMFLASLGGDIPDERILKPTGIAKELLVKIKSASAGADAETSRFKPYLEGDPEKGRALFWDVNGKAGCAKCHAVGAKGGNVGPALTNVAGTRKTEYIIESILKPSAVIVNWFEPVLVLAKDNKRLSGAKKDETREFLTLGLSTGELVTIQKSDIKKWKVMKKSIMPGNFGEILSVDELHDLIAYLGTLT